MCGRLVERGEVGFGEYQRLQEFLVWGGSDQKQQWKGYNHGLVRGWGFLEWHFESPVFGPGSNWIQNAGNK